MKRKTIKVFLLFSLYGVAISCYHNDVPEFHEGQVEGYQPVYATDGEASITVKQPQPLQQPGKIFVYGNILLVNEKLKGIHVYNNADPSNPQALAFISIYGNLDMAVKGNTLVVDHLGDVVTLDVSNWSDVQEISRVSSWSNEFPPDRGRYFECVDASKGEVIGWILTTLTNPKCYR